MRRALFLAPVVLTGLAAAAWFVLSGGGTGPVPLTIGEQTEPQLDSRSSPGEQREAEWVNDRVAIHQMAQELGVPELAEDEAEDGSALVVRGRVVTALQQPVATAAINVRVRRNVRAFFENSGPGGAAQPDFDWQSVFRQRNLGKEVMTDSNGVFTIAGRTFTRGAGVEIAATHREFAPQVINVDWEPSQGELTLPDIVLGVGATVSGVVVDSVGAPVAEATVTLEPGNASTDNRGPGGGPGGPGGFGRGGRGRQDDTLRKLLGEGVTDASGRFTFQHVPAGSVAVMASAARHLDGRSDRADIADGAQLDVGQIHLGPGAELSGVVRDDAGTPVAGATVSIAYAADSRGRGNQPGTGGRGRGGNANGDATSPAAPRGNGPDIALSAPDNNGNNGGRRGRANNGDPRQGPGAGGPGGFFGGPGRGGNSNFSTKTDKEGRYQLDRVPAEELTVSVRHDSFIDERLEPVDPRIQSHVDFQLTRRPAIVGSVIDAASGEPVELYGIRWRRDNSADMQRGFQQFGDRMAQADDPNADPARAQMMQQMRDMAAQFEQSIKRQEELRRNLLGGSGQVPGPTPKANSHQAGRFRLDAVEPGTFLIDVDAPGYIKLAAGPFTVSADTPPTELTIRVERGAAMKGIVVSANNNTPVGGARISLSIPTDDSAQMPNFGGFGRGGRGGRGGGGGPGGMFRTGRDVLAQVRSASDGRFELPPLRPGRYALEIRADGFPDYSSQDFVVAVGAPESVVRIDPGARLYGRISGIEQGSRATLELTHTDNRDRRTTRIDDKTGDYSVSGLAAGGWVIQLVGEGQRGSFRQRLGAFLGASSNEAPDVVLQPGQELRHDIDASSAMPGVVQGYVIRNGQPGGGLEVRLVEADSSNRDPNAPPSPQQMFARFGRGGGMLRSSVDAADGSFKIDSVPSGIYTLEVHERMGRGGGGGPRARSDNALYSTAIDIRRGQTLLQQIQISTGSIALAVRRKDGQDIGRVSVQLVRAAEAGQLPPEQWRELPSYRQMSSRGGDGDLGEFAPDSYAFSISINGTRGLTGQILVGVGSQVRIEGELETAEGNAANPSPGSGPAPGPNGTNGTPGAPNGAGGGQRPAGGPGGNRGRGGRGGQNGQGQGGGAPNRGGN